MEGGDEYILNELIKKINNLYYKLELENTKIPLTRLQALEDIKRKALLRRNLLRKNLLKFSEEMSRKIDSAIRNYAVQPNRFLGRYSFRKTKSLRQSSSDSEDAERQEEENSGSKNGEKAEVGSSAQLVDLTTKSRLKNKEKPLKLKEESRKRRSLQLHYDPEMQLWVNQKQNRSSESSDSECATKPGKSSTIQHQSRNNTDPASRKNSDNQLGGFGNESQSLVNNLIRGKRISFLFKRAVSGSNNSLPNLTGEEEFFDDP